MRAFAALTLMAGLASAGAAQAFPIAASGTEGVPVLVNTTGNVTVTYQGNSADFTDQLFLASPTNASNTIFVNHNTPAGTTFNLGTFTAGTELLFGMDVLNTGDVFFTGASSRNPDNATHARVQAGYAPNTTLVSFEDLFNGPFDFNDLSFTLTVAPIVSVSSNAQAVSLDIPEPMSLTLAGIGLLGLACRRPEKRRR